MKEEGKKKMKGKNQKPGLVLQDALQGFQEQWNYPLLIGNHMFNKVLGICRQELVKRKEGYFSYQYFKNSHKIPAKWIITMLKPSRRRSSCQTSLINKSIFSPSPPLLQDLGHFNHFQEKEIYFTATCCQMETLRWLLGSGSGWRKHIITPAADVLESEGKTLK